MFSIIALFFVSTPTTEPTPPGWYPVPPGLEATQNQRIINEDTRQIRAPQTLELPSDSDAAWLASLQRPAPAPVVYESAPVYQPRIRTGRSLFRNCGPTG